MAIQTLFGSVPQEPNLLDRLKAGIQKTRQAWSTGLKMYWRAGKRSMPIFSKSLNTR